MYFSCKFLSNFVITTALALMATHSLAAGKYWNTYPMPPKVKPQDPLAVAPGAQVPDNQDSYTFTTTAAPKVLGTEEIFVYSIDTDGPLRRRTRIGSMPAGTEVKMTSVSAVGKTLYYAVSWQNRTAWINGYNIKATAYNPTVK